MKSYIKDNFIVLAGVFIINLKAIILMPLIIDKLGVAVYGGYILLASILSLTFSVCTLGVGTSAKRFLPSVVSMSNRAELYYPQFFFVFMGALVSCVFLLAFHRTIDDLFFQGSVDYSLYVIPAYFFGYFMYTQGVDYFRYTSRISRMIICTTIFPYLHVAVVVFGLYQLNILSVDALILSESFCALLVGLICAYKVVGELKFDFHIYKLNKLKAEIKLGMPLMLNVVVDFVLAASDRYLISLFISISAVGYYHPAYLVGSLPLAVPRAMGLVVPQLLSKAVDSGRKQSAVIMQDFSVKLFLIIIIPFIFGSVLLADDLIELLANKEIAQKSMYVTPVVAVGVLFYGLIYILSNIVFVELKTKLLFKVNLYAALLNFVLNVILLYWIKNIMVAAFTTVISYFLSFVYLNHELKKFWVVQYDYAFIFRLIVASAFMFIVLWLMLDCLAECSAIYRLTLGLLGSLIAYVVGLATMGVISPSKIQDLKSILS